MECIHLSTPLLTIEESRRVPVGFHGTLFTFDPAALSFRAAPAVAEALLPRLGFIARDVNLPAGTRVVPSRVEARQAHELLLAEDEDRSRIAFEGEDLTARSACLMDRQGHVLIGKREHDLAYPASTTKIVTALTALDVLAPEDTITVGDELDLTFEGDDPSLADIKKGERWTFRDLLHGMLLPSGNDAAYEVGFLTEQVLGTTGSPREVIDTFVARMNAKAQALGLGDSHFMVPDGNSYYTNDGDWDARMKYQVTSAHDLARAGLVLLQSPLLRTVVRTAEITLHLESGEEKHFTNTNRFLHPSRPEHDPFVIGVKTGTTNPAGPCLVAAREEDGELLMACTLFNDNGSARYENARRLFDAGMNAIKTRKEEHHD